MVEFIKSILRWIILAIIIILIIVLIYNIANASSKKASKNSNLSSGVRTVEPSNKKNKTNNNNSSSSSNSNSSDRDLAVLEDNTNQEVTTPDTASFSGISVFLGVAILGGTTYYLLKKTEVIK